MTHERTAVLQWSSAMILSGTIGAVVVESGAAPAFVAFSRCLIGGGLLMAWCAVGGWLPEFRMERRDLLWALGGGLMLTGNWVLLFASYALSSISVSSVVYHTQPLIFVGLAALWQGAVVTGGQWLRAAVAFGGVVAIALSAHGVDGRPVRPAGIALALGAAVLYAGTTLVARRLAHLRPHVLAAMQLCASAVVLAPVAFSGPWPLPVGFGWLMLLGTVHTAVMYVLMYSSVGTLPAGGVAVLSYLYPVVAVIVDVLAYGHRPGPVELAGMAAVLGAAIQVKWSRAVPAPTRGSAAAPR